MPRRLTEKDVGLKKDSLLKAFINTIKRKNSRIDATIKLLKGAPKESKLLKLNKASIDAQLKAIEKKTKPGAMDDNAMERARKRQEEQRKALKEASGK